MLGTICRIQRDLGSHSPDQALAEQLKAAIERKDSGSGVFFVQAHLRAGNSLSARLAKETAETDAFILPVGIPQVDKIFDVPE